MRVVGTVEKGDVMVPGSEESYPHRLRNSNFLQIQPFMSQFSFGSVIKTFMCPRNLMYFIVQTSLKYDVYTDYTAIKQMRGLLEMGDAVWL